tara:strand:- start:1262 stop:1606 length:345 start_codon:yes stop_codon:yes gene_type:complete
LTPDGKPTILTIQPDFTMRGYYSVFNPRGEKIADCGSQRDAVNLIGMRNNRWDGHYYMFNPLPGDIIDVNTTKTIESEYVHINDDPHDGWWLKPEHQDWNLPELPENQQQPLDL